MLLVGFERRTLRMSSWYQLTPSPPSDVTIVILIPYQLTPPPSGEYFNCAMSSTLVKGTEHTNRYSPDKKEGVSPKVHLQCCHQWRVVTSTNSQRNTAPNTGHTLAVCTEIAIQTTLMTQCKFTTKPNISAISIVGLKNTRFPGPAP